MAIDESLIQVHKWNPETQEFDVVSWEEMIEGIQAKKEQKEMKLFALSEEEELPRLSDANKELTEVTIPRQRGCAFCSAAAQYNGKTSIGHWANMCEVHFQRYGTGLGLGKVSG